MLKRHGLKQLTEPSLEMESTGQWTRVILLTPPAEAGGGLTESLRSHFEQRDWFAIQQHDPFLAFVELCLRDKAQATRASWGLQRMEQLALVITHAESWNHLDQLAAAVRKYVPVASIWIANDEGVHPWSVSQGRERVRSVPSSAAQNTIDEQAAVGAADSPAFSGASPISTSLKNGLSNHEEKRDPKTESQRITREEIDMLLSMDPGEVHEERGT
jgi:hypothetical protein